QAIASTQGVGGAAEHLRDALEQLADRVSPNYRNSIKDSISAVESVVKVIAGTNARLGKALKRLTDAGIDIHPSLREGFSKLYGYSSDADGIRHAMMEESNLGQDDA